MRRESKTARPPDAATVVLPLSVPLAGLVPIASGTFELKPVSTLPSVSWAVICMAGGVGAPAVAPGGRGRKAQRAALQPPPAPGRNTPQAFPGGSQAGG